MTQTEFQGAPRIILERRDERPPLYWIRSKEGSYKQVKSKYFRMMASMIYGRSESASLRNEALENYVAVRCFAGLQPGLYRDHQSSFFLNPEFVPLDQPLQAAAPPKEFQDIFNKCIHLHEKDADKHEKEIQRLQLKLREIYLEERNATVAKGKIHPWRVIGIPFRHDEFPCDDHCQLFETRNSYLWTSQPYGINKAEILGFARLHGLNVQISREWSWHLPGRSILIEWSKASLF